MKAYIICFGITLIFTYLAQKQINTRKKIDAISLIYILICIFTLCFFAGVRNIHVGRDVEVYVTPAIEMSQKYSFMEYLDRTNTEIGFDIYIYILATLFSSDVNFILFFLQLIPAVSVYIFAYKKRNEISMFLVILVYIFTWYLTSYTIMRQSLSLGLILVSLTCLEERKYKKTIILFLIALLFHSSAAIAVGLYIILFISRTTKFSKTQKKYIYIFFVIALIIMLLSYEKILLFFTTTIKILPYKYYAYLDSKYSLDSASVNWNGLFFRIIWVGLSAIYIYIMSIRKKSDENFNRYFMYSLIGLLTFLISFKITNAQRMSFAYFYPGILYCIPKLVGMFKKDKLNKIGSVLIITTILMVFWIYKYPITKECETYPYKSDIIQFLN